MSILPVQPPILTMPFASKGDKSTIPVSSTVIGKATQEQGFPKETAAPASSNSKPPTRADMNGFLNVLSSFAFYQQSGGIPSWNSNLNYLHPSFIVHNSTGVKVLYWALTSSGPGISGVGPKEPGTPAGQNYWVDFVKSVTPSPVKTDNLINGFKPGDIDFKPQRASKLNVGWYPMDGLRYPLNSPVGLVLQSFTTEFKSDWGIVIDAFGINVPNWYHSDGRGPIMRAVNSISRFPGSIEIDAVQNIEGRFLHANFMSGYGDGVHTGPFYVTGGYGAQGGETGGYSQGLGFDASRQVRTADEVRMLNRGLTPAMYFGV